MIASMLDVVKGLFQSTLPYGSDRPLSGLWLRRSYISIHAPSRERQNGCTARCCLCGFQSTLPHGSDAMLLLMLAAAVVISIHAPSRERRPSFITSAPLSMISIHAPLRERRLLFLPALGATTFQSTLHYGSDRNIVNIRTIFIKFQSTLPYGSDLQEGERSGLFYISIHAPLRERLQEGLIRININAFQSTLPYGSDTA